MGKRTPQAVWDQMRLAHAQGVGLRELARKAGVSESAVLQRAHREKWTEHLKQAAVITKSADVISQVENTVDDLKQIGERTRRGFATAAEKVAKRTAEMDEDELLLTGQAVRPWQQIASSVHGWDKPDPSAGRGAINLTINISRDDVKPAQVVDVQADVKAIEP